MNDILIFVVLVVAIGGVLYWKKLEKKGKEDVSILPPRDRGDPPPFTPPKPIVEPPIVLRPPQVEPAPPEFKVPAPGPNKPEPTPENPEPAPWGYNGHPVSDMNITPEKSNQHQLVWMIDGQPAVFTVHVTKPGSLEIWVSNTPMLGNPDPSLSRHEIEATLSQHGNIVAKIPQTFIASARLTVPVSPGTCQFTAWTVGYTGGVDFQFLYH